MQRSFDKNSLNRIKDDPCFLQQQVSDNSKKLKFVTTNYTDLIHAKHNYNFFGMTMSDGLFVPSNKIDNLSNLLNGANGNNLTNCNVKNGYGQLPFPTAPSKYQTAHGNVDIESIHDKTDNEVNRKTCNPSDNSFYKRSFYIFDNIESPNALKSVETHEMGPRGGASTRFFG